MAARRTTGTRGTAERGERERDRERERRQEEREESPRQQLNEYFIKGEGINREVLQAEICRFLGADAYSRPYKSNGVDGFLIKAIRPFTTEMIKDLKVRSANYEADRVTRQRRGHDKGNSYEDFQNRRSTGPSMDDRDRYPGGYPSAASPPYNQDAAPYQPLQPDPYGGPGGGFGPNLGHEHPGYGGGSGVPSVYPTGYSVTNQGIPSIPAQAGGYPLDPRYAPPGYGPYGGQPSREQPQQFNYSPGNAGYDSRREHPSGYYPPGQAGDRPGPPDSMSGVVSPGSDVYGHPPPFPGQQQQAPYRQGGSSRSDYPPRQGESYNQGTRRR